MELGIDWALWALPVFALLSAAICFKAQVLGTRLKVMDLPNADRKFHAQPTPLLGGLAVTVPFVAGAFVMIAVGEAPGVLSVLIVLLLGFVALGFADDRSSMSPLARLACGVALVALFAPIHHLLVLEGLAFSFLDNPLPLGVFAVAFTALVVVGLVNALNMTDGIDGLLPGLWVIWTLGFLAYAPVAWLPLGLLVLASLLVVLVFNWRSRLFLGDAGSYAAGALLGFSAIALYNAPAVSMPADVAVAWFLIPVIDCLRVMLRRVLRGRSPMSADRDHLHHRLGRRLGRRSTVVAYWALVAVPVAATVHDPYLAPAAIGFAFAAYGMALFFTARPLQAQGGAESVG